MGEVLRLDDFRDPEAPRVQLQTLARTDWTPGDLEVALRGADQGILTDAADLVETLLTDDRIQGTVSTRTLGMLALPLAFDGDRELSDVLSGGTDGASEWARMFPEPESVELLKWGIVLGVGFARKIPTYANGMRSFRIEHWHPRWFQWRHSEQCWYVTHAAGHCRIDPGDGWIVFTPYGKDRPWARGLWRGLAFAWVLKQFSVLDRSRHAEVTGSPVRVGIADEGATEGMRRKFQSILQNLSRDSAIVLPTGYRIELVEATGRTGDIYQAQIDWANGAISVMVAGQVVTTEGSKGFSDGKIQSAVARGLIRFTGQAYGGTLHEQGLTGWAAANYPGRVAPVPRWDAQSNEERLEWTRAGISLGEAISKMNAALSPSGYQVDAVALAAQFGWTTVQLPQNREEAPTIALAPTDIAKVVRVNEARASAGLGPMKLRDGSEDPDGYLTVAQFAAKNEAQPGIPGADGAPQEVARATQEREAQAAVNP